jgi:hypothetical protein
VETQAQKVKQILASDEVRMDFGDRDDNWRLFSNSSVQDDEAEMNPIASGRRKG